MSDKADVEVYELQFGPLSWVPNNEALPVVIYTDVFVGHDGEDDFEQLFARNGWTAIWRNGVFDYDHYHTGAHEALGVTAGTATLRIGGPEGKLINVKAGDCLVLPAGTGHRRMRSSDDFVVVGAYPPGQSADIQTRTATPEQLENIKELARPESDPIEGRGGYLLKAWE
jgi:uncharacterized protein YjlB